MGIFDNLFTKSENQKEVKVTQSKGSSKIKLEELTTKEMEFVDQNISIAIKLLEHYNIEFNQPRLHPDNISGFSYHWFEKNLKGDTTLSDEKFSNCMAAGWGKYLMETYKMSWKVITDEFGTEIGLYYATNETTVFPFISMSKAIKNKNYELIWDITEKIDEVLKLK